MKKQEAGARRQKVYRIGRRKYWMPATMQLQQYNGIMDLVERVQGSGFGVPGSEKDFQGSGFVVRGSELRALSVVRELMKDGHVERFMSLVLAPEGKDWNPIPEKKASKMFARATDETVVEVMTDFFIGRTALIAELARSFLPLMTRIVSMMRQSAGNSSESSSQDPSSSTGTTTVSGQFSHSEQPAESREK